MSRARDEKRSLTRANLYRLSKTSHTEPSLMGKDGDLGHVKFPADASTEGWRREGVEEGEEPVFSLEQNATNCHKL